jgi:colanic acid biosynthesis glycosyl transferase WcaI
MKITLITPIYPPEILPAGIMISQLATHLAARKCEITVCTTFPSLPEGNTFPGYRRRIWEFSIDNGVKLVRCFSFNMGIERRPQWRLLKWLSFGMIAGILQLCQKKVDVILMEAYPIIGSIPILLAALLRGIPVINYVQDMYPEAAEAAGILKSSGRASRACRWLDTLICRFSRINLVISEDFGVKLVESRQVSPTKIATIYNWIDGSHVKPLSRINTWREDNRIPAEKFVVLFSGTLGLASGANILIDVARLLSVRQSFDFLMLIVGEGLLKKTMEECAVTWGLDNVVFLPFQPADRLAEVQATGDVMFLPVAGGHAFSSVPSKLVTYMAAGRPILCAADEDSTVARTVERAGCGRVIPPDDSFSVVEALIQMATMKQELATMGANGRSFFEEHFERQRAMDAFERLFSQFASPEK